MLRSTKLFSIKMAALAAIPVMLFSCKKEDAKFPYTDIVSFTVDASGQAVKAAVTGDSIILYFPVGQAIPENITPEITVSDGATISPASGTTVALKETVVYNVTAQTGITKQYKVYIPNNQPKPVVRSYSGITTYNGKRYMRVDNGEFQFLGDYFATGGTATLLTMNDQEKPTTNSFLVPIQWRFKPLEKGTYKAIVLNNAGYTTTIKDTFDVIDNPFPNLTAFTAPVTVKRGTDITLAGNNLNYVISASIRNAATSLSTAVTVKSVTANSITLTIPAGLVAGNYNRIVMGFSAFEYSAAGSASVLLNAAAYLVVTE